MNESINESSNTQDKQELDNIEGSDKKTSSNYKTIAETKGPIIINVVPRTKLKISSKEFNLNLCWHCQTFVSLGPLLTLCQLCYFIQSYLVGHYDIEYRQQVKLVNEVRQDRFILLDQYGPQYSKEEYVKQHEDYLTILLSHRFKQNKANYQQQQQSSKVESQIDKANIHAANQWHNDRQEKYKAEFNKATNY